VRASRQTPLYGPGPVDPPAFPTVSPAGRDGGPGGRASRQRHAPTGARPTP
jgi:hypothetical protein